MRIRFPTFPKVAVSTMASLGLCFPVDNSAPIWQIYENQQFSIFEESIDPLASGELPQTERKLKTAKRSH